MFDFNEDKRKKKNRKKKAQNGSEENFLEEYVLVYSATESIIGKYIEEILKCEPFTRESKNEPTGLIWITEKSEKSTGELSNKSPLESDKETGETPAKEKWSFGSDNFITVSEEDEVTSAAQKKKLDIYDYNEIKPLEAGADEVFSREVLKSQTMALSILNCKVPGAIEKICRKNNDAFVSSEAPHFLGQLGLQKEKTELGMRSAYVQALRLSLKKWEYFLLDNDNWETFRKAASDVNLYPLVFFSSDPEANKYTLEGLRIKERVELTSGDSILFLTHSGVTLRKFGEAILKPPYVKDRRKEGSFL